MRRVALIALLMLSCGPLVHAQMLSLAYTKGAHYNYKLHITSKEAVQASVMSMPFETDITANETVSVQSVDSSGVADLSLTLSNASMKMSMTIGQSSTTTTITKFPVPAQDVRIAPDGRLLSVNGTSLTGSSQFGALGGNYLISAVLPDTAVKPGDTWTKDYDQANPSGGGSVHVTTKSTYVTDESVNGVKAAVVKTTSTATFNLTIDFGALPISGLTNPSDASPSPNVPTLPAAGPGAMTLGGTITSDITTWIDPGSHRILKSHMSAKDDMTLTLAGSPSSSYNSSMGPIAVKGTETMTLDPA